MEGYLLKNVTKNEIDMWIKEENDYKLNLLSQEIYNLASYFIITKNNRIKNIELDDYLQTLVSFIWSKINKFDDKKGSFTTWCYFWFRSKHKDLTYNRNRSLDICSLDIPLINGDNEGEQLFLLDSLGEDENKIDNILFNEIYDTCSYNFKLWLNGLSFNEIAKINNCYRQQIKREIESEIKRIRERLGINESSIKI